MALPALDPLEVHSGMVTGARRSPAPPTAQRTGPPGAPREVLEGLLVEALQEPPCHVAFSGGRDSSVILAAATHAARRHGLPDPVPLTWTFEDPESGEVEWQERTMGHLGLHEWRRIEVTGELDALGELPTGALLRHGLYWPAMAHSTLHFSRILGGKGALVTGGGGDELFSPWYWRRFTLRETLAYRPRVRAVKWTGYYTLPLAARQRMAASFPPVQLPWLRPGANAELNARKRAGDRGGRSWQEDLERLIDGRYLELLRSALDTFAAQEGIRLVEPFYDPRFMRAVAPTVPRSGYPSRGKALEALFSDLLPRDVLYRSTKAHFTSSLWGPRSRAFIEAWDGSGVDDAIVDPERLHAEWRRPRPDIRAATVLQAAWLAGQRAQAPAVSSSS